MSPAKEPIANATATEPGRALLARRSARATIWAAVAGGLPASIYAGGYAYARLSHSLVRYSSGDAKYDAIERADRLRGFGFSIWELVFVPLVAIELAIRRHPFAFGAALCVAAVACVVRLNRARRGPGNG